jgi:hypothetical protein
MRAGWGPKPKSQWPYPRGGRLPRGVEPEDREVQQDGAGPWPESELQWDYLPSLEVAVDHFPSFVDGIPHKGWRTG